MKLKDNVTVNEDEQSSIEFNQDVVSNEQTSPEQNTESNNQSSTKQETPKQEGISKEYNRTKTTTHDESQMSNPEYEQYKQAQQFTQELEQGKHQNGVGGGPGMTSLLESHSMTIKVEFNKNVMH